MLMLVRLLLLQLNQTSRWFKVAGLGLIVLTASLFGCGLLGRMFLFQDLQLSGCDSLVRFPGWFYGLYPTIVASPPVPSSPMILRGLKPV